MVATHDERTAKREAREHEQLLAHLNRRDAFDMILDELRAAERDIAIRVDNRRIFGGAQIASSRWTQNSPVLNDPHLTETRDLVATAYAEIVDINKRTHERFLAADAETNDPNWWILHPEEQDEHNAALIAVRNAIKAVVAVRAKLD